MRQLVPQNPLRWTALQSLFFALAILASRAFDLAASQESRDSTLFESAITESLKRVDEFEFAKKVAQKIGVRVYLFGGTASSFGHYVREFLEASDEIKDFYDFDYTSIYRSTQDADLVIDGTADQARQFELEMMSRFDHLQGTKSVWEVRTLREARDDKGAILGDFDFLNQHTDSNSVGLIELTDPPSFEPRIRDARSWASKNHPFLESIRSGEIQFYFSENHQKTSRYRSQQNPEIFSVIRFLTKAFQHELEISDDDFKTLQKIVDGFNPDRDLTSSYSRSWIEKNAKKLMLNSRNLERSWNTLERLNLRKKLIRFGSPHEVGSMSWWLNKEPLRSFPIGQGAGSTAAELGIETIAHETRGQDSDDATAAFRAFESITASPSLEANVFVSRQRGVGELAAYGEGFYTRIGDQGAVGSGYTIRFRLHPQAREGTDFEQSGDFVIVKNKNAIQVIAEKLRKSPIEYLETLNELELKSSDRALIHQFTRRVLSKAKILDIQMLNSIFDFTKQKIEDLKVSKSALTWALQVLQKASSKAHVEKLFSAMEKTVSQSHNSFRTTYSMNLTSKFFLEKESFAYAHHLSSLYHRLTKDPENFFALDSDVTKALLFQLENNPDFGFTDDEIADIKNNALRNISRGNSWSSTTSILILMSLRDNIAIDEIFQRILERIKIDHESREVQENLLHFVFGYKASFSYSRYLKYFIPSGSYAAGRFFFESLVLPLHLQANSKNLASFVKDLIFFQDASGVLRLDWKTSISILKVIEEKNLAAPKGLVDLLTWLASNPKHSFRNRLFGLDLEREMTFRKEEALRRLKELESDSLGENERVNQIKHYCRRVLRSLN